MANLGEIKGLRQRLGLLRRSLLAKVRLLHPKVGVAVVIFDGDKILLGQRIGSTLGNGCWQVSGGHLEFGETFEQCAAREVKEETGLEIKNIRAFHVTNEIYPREVKHYATVWMMANAVLPLALDQYKEVDKCQGWSWFDIDSLPAPLFEGGDVLTLKNLHKLRSLFS